MAPPRHRQTPPEARREAYIEDDAASVIGRAAATDRGLLGVGLLGIAAVVVASSRLTGDTCNCRRVSCDEALGEREP